MLRFSANLSLLFQELPFLQRFEAARCHGFDAVEIQFPYEEPAERVRVAAVEAGLPVVLINAPIGPDPRSGGIACRAEHASVFRSELTRAAEYAQALGAPHVNVLAGRCTPAEHSACVARLGDALRLAGEVLRGAGARPVLEVINPLDVPGYCVPDYDLAARVLAGVPAAALQFDVYHAARVGLSPSAAFAAALPLTAHVQFSDCPGRHEPGTGELDFPSLFASIDASGYAGTLGAEYIPSRPTPETLGWLTQARRRVPG